jgi:hypothetical protein
MNVLRRISRLEGMRSPKRKYLCVIGLPEQNGFKVQPLDDPKGEAFYLKTRKELEAFGERPDVELTQIDVIYRDVKGGD